MRIIILVACLWLATSPLHGKIVFYSNRDGNYEIYTMKSDGTHQIRLTFNGTRDSYPVWSPDGEQILFQSDFDLNPEVYVMNADGTNPRNLSNHLAVDSYPDWSPDGSRIVFVSERNPDGFSSLFMMDADGSNVKGVKGWRLVTKPKWSPTGKQIAFGDSPIYVVNAEGRAPWKVSKRPNVESAMFLEGWSPDGTQILFSEAALASDKHTLVVATLEPIRRRMIIQWRRVPVSSRLQTVFHSAAFSADGKSILFSGKPNDADTWDIYRFQLADRKLTQLTDSPGADLAPHEWLSPLSVSPQQLTSTLWGEIKETK